MLAQIKAGRAHQITHIFNKQHIYIIKRYMIQGIMYQKASR